MELLRVPHDTSGQIYCFNIFVLLIIITNPRFKLMQIIAIQYTQIHTHTHLFMQFIQQFDYVFHSVTKS